MAKPLKTQSSLPTLPSMRPQTVNMSGAEAVAQQNELLKKRVDYLNATLAKSGRRVTQTLGAQFRSSNREVTESNVGTMLSCPSCNSLHSKVRKLQQEMAANKRANTDVSEWRQRAMNAEIQAEDRIQQAVSEAVQRSEEAIALSQRAIAEAKEQADRCVLQAQSRAHAMVAEAIAQREAAEKEVVIATQAREEAERVAATTTHMQILLKEAERKAGEERERYILVIQEKEAQQKKIADLLNEIDVLTQNFTAKIKEIDVIHEQMQQREAELRQKVLEQQAKLSELTSQLDAHGTQMAYMSSQKASYEQRCRHLEEQQVAATAEINALKTAAATGSSAETTINVLQQQIESLGHEREKRAASEAATRKSLEDCVGDLEKRLAIALASVETLQQSAVREMVGTVRVAVLTPILKLNINGSTTTTLTSADPVPLAKLRSVLEREVLSQFVDVCGYKEEDLMGNSGGGGGGGAASFSAVFPAIHTCMQRLQEEVSARLRTEGCDL